MNNLRLVAIHEFTERLRSRAFIVSNVAILGLLVLSVVLPTFMHDETVVDVGYLEGPAEHVGELAVAQQSNFDTEVELVALSDRAEAERALDDESVTAVLLDTSTVLTVGNLDTRLEALLASAANGVAIDGVLDEAGIAPQDRAALFAIEPLTIEQHGDSSAVDLFDPSVMVVFVAVFLLYGLLAVYGQWVAQGIVEEKQSRVVEILLATVRPSELLAGKVLGLGALGLVQVLLMTAVGAGGLLITDVIEVPRAAWGALALVLPWYVLGFLLYSSLFAMAGAVVSRAEDVPSAVMPVIVVLVLALFAAQFAVSDPTGTVATIAGVFPLTAPIVQPVLFAFGVASWGEILLAIVLAAGMIAAVLPIAARIYSGGVLRTRGRVSFRDAWGSTGR
jgi:ABC-2 type transport system permease protein